MGVKNMWKILVFLIMVIYCWASMAEAEYFKYKDPKQRLGVRIKDLMKRMTIEEKIGQMTQADRSVVSKEVMEKYFIGSILNVPWTVPAKEASPKTWVDMVNDLQSGSLSTRLGIPIIYGIDAVRGNNDVYKATLFPHNVGLGVTRQDYKEISLSVQERVFLSSMDRMNAGIDMFMVGFTYEEFITQLTYLVMNKFVPMRRVDDAVKRILRVKFIMGLFENPLADYSMAKYLGCQEHRDLAREAVRKTLVLLKNGKSLEKPLLPLSKKASKILVAESHADNLGYQCGGWTIEWQGLSGNNITAGTTILSAVKMAVNPRTQVVYNANPNADFIKSNKFDFAIVVVGEYPYAEYLGDSSNLTIPEPGPSTIKSVCGSVKCVVVLITGRPVVVQPYVETIDALVAAWLPGTEGQGVADLLFGDHGFTGKLARTWFKSVDQLPMNVGDPHYDPLYPFGFGLTT
ncbi:hypothetical protein L1987_75620 [Smallanthus sonchifolius]|uniref:Uncharacterized protein n=1 Tax=Smallanthus sonchifolius TaxID=185202 RepID=A0ACB9A6G8_9ASTR|nr:hypothetical protein L1987_75620 [Smallanthus sonchifolius]